MNRSAFGFSKDVKLAAWRRANGHCEKCTAPLAQGKFRYDHRNPKEFSNDHSLENCQVLCDACDHTKTYKRDIPAIAKSNRVRERHAGIRPDRTTTAWRKWD